MGRQPICGKLQRRSSSLIQIAVLSPHRDDAVFSLGVTLARFSHARVQVLNFFTRSIWAPRLLGHDNTVAAVSRARRREDRRALKSLDADVHVRDFEFLDAPVRLNVETARVLGPNATPVAEADVIAVAKELTRLHADVVFAPLALGNHVDHRIVRQAALRAISRHKLAFYEDLPYAMWTPAHELRKLVEELRLRPALIRGPVWRKRRAAALYATQVPPEDANCMARYTAAQHGERIWLAD